MTNSKIANSTQKKRKTFIGPVISDKNDKTITVCIETAKMHPIYKRRYKSRKNFHAHDPKNLAKVGDLVKIVESRPYSALKRFLLVEIVKQPVDNSKIKITEKEQN